MNENCSPIICALDTTDIQQARTLTSQVRDSIGAIKLGLEFFTANGSAGVSKLAAENMPIFLDLKFHDIPNTVASAIRSTAGINTFMMTVHTMGGRAMLQSAIDASMEVAEQTGKERPLIIGVTVLTSLDHADLSMVGLRDEVHDQVRRLADLAQSCRLDGVVCSPYEISLLREHCGDDFTLVVPGIRPADSHSNDQKRVMTPKEALNKVADYLVIGRPITHAKSPENAAKVICAALQ
ncbi:MAG: orotidine-5'-phosphate decarboxylase [Alphaproteobacteria bacterium]|nr:orotidine-5'-phosphate decarboxylase [Alphaproteobacteria bacterium]